MTTHPEIASLLPEQNFNRREFLVTSLAAGFALAVQPVSAQTITTDSEDLLVGEVKVKTPDGEIPAYRAMPASGKNFPVVLVVQEIFGVHEHIKDVCRRFAKMGYLAIAPELFARQGNPAKLGSVKEIVDSIVSKVPDAQVMSDLDATAAYARSTGKAHSDRLAVTGFCWGGRITWLYAAHNPKLKAGVAWYGRLVGQASANTPKHPIDVVNALHAPVLGLYGGADQGIPNDTVEKMLDALKEANKPSQIVLYPDTPHAFFADYRPSYRKEQAEEAWKRLHAWLQKHGA